MSVVRQQPAEPWCRECGLHVADKDVHDRWHDRIAGRKPPAPAKCRDIHPNSRPPLPPGPPSVPRTCALPPGHDGQHDRDGVRW